MVDGGRLTVVEQPWSSRAVGTVDGCGATAVVEGSVVGQCKT
jgi:hypothetical protein